VLRDFSAPVRFEMERSRDELAFLMAHDSDAFNRWDAGQELFGGVVLGLAADHAARRPLELPALVVDAFRELLLDDALDGSFKALALTLPDELVLGQKMEVIDPDAVHAARDFVRRELAAALRDELLETYAKHAPEGAYSPDKAAIDRRRVKNCALAYLSRLEQAETTALVREQFESADNMTDSVAALVLLSDIDTPEREDALAAFHRRWRQDPLVIDKWFMIQARATLPGAPERVRALAEHPDFTLRNPNRVRSLVGVFGNGNPAGFHACDGAGYAFVADHVLALDPLNPQLAAGMVRAFNHWKRYDGERKAAMRAQLARIAAADELSRDVYEIVDNALGGA
jgi:aminopeptidase N